MIRIRHIVLALSGYVASASAQTPAGRPAPLAPRTIEAVRAAGDDASALFRAPAKDVLMIKVAYWFDR